MLGDHLGSKLSPGVNLSFIQGQTDIDANENHICPIEVVVSSTSCLDEVARSVDKLHGHRVEVFVRGLDSGEDFDS